VKVRSGGAAFCVGAGTLAVERLAGSAIFCGVAHPRHPLLTPAHLYSPTAQALLPFIL